MWVLHRVSGVKVIAGWRKPPEKMPCKKLRPIYRSNMKSGGVKGNSASLTRLSPLQGWVARWLLITGLAPRPTIPPPLRGSVITPNPVASPPKLRRSVKTVGRSASSVNGIIPQSSPALQGLSAAPALRFVGAPLIVPVKKAGARSGDDCAPAV